MHRHFGRAHLKRSVTAEQSPALALCAMRSARTAQRLSESSQFLKQWEGGSRSVRCKSFRLTSSGGVKHSPAVSASS